MSHLATLLAFTLCLPASALAALPSPSNSSVEPDSEQTLWLLDLPGGEGRVRFELPPGDTDYFFFKLPSRARLSVGTEHISGAHAPPRFQLKGPDGQWAPPSKQPLPAGGYILRVDTRSKSGLGPSWLHIKYSAAPCMGPGEGCDPALSSTPSLDFEPRKSSSTTYAVAVQLVSTPALSTLEFGLRFDPKYTKLLDLTPSAEAKLSRLELKLTRPRAGQVQVVGFVVGGDAQDPNGDGRYHLGTLRFETTAPAATVIATPVGCLDHAGQPVKIPAVTFNLE